jgi:hypothetical protein
MSSPAERFEQFLKQGGIADLSDRVQLRLTGTIACDISTGR